MISGPTLPRTRSGLWSTILDHIHRVERGLTVVHEDIRTEEDIHVDALACDANGHPVVLFLLMQEETAEFVRRLLAFDRWFAQHRGLLLQSLWLGGVDRTLEPRVFVIGCDIPDPVVERLRQTQIPRLEVFQFCTFSVGGVLRVGVTPLLSPLAAAAEGSFQVPAGLTDPQARTLCGTLLGWIQKLEPTIQVQGDRYSRRFLLEGELLAELVVERNCIRLLVPGGGERAKTHRGALGSAWEIAEAFDAVARRYLRLVCGDQALSIYEPPETGSQAEATPSASSQDWPASSSVSGRSTVPGQEQMTRDSVQRDPVAPLRAASGEASAR